MRISSGLTPGYPHHHSELGTKAQHSTCIDNIDNEGAMTHRGSKQKNSRGIVNATIEAAVPLEATKQVSSAMVAYLRHHPPTIGVIGASGTGKSSTINAMFKTNLPISHAVACTKEFLNVDLNVTATSASIAGDSLKLCVVDAPGLGEDLARDPDYLDMYQTHLSRCDIVLWVMAARQRAIALDQGYLQLLADHHEKIVFGLNQIDLIDPMNWNCRLNLPSDDQEKIITEIAQDRSAKISATLGRPVEMHPYSAGNLYGLQELFSGMIASCPDGKRAWIFDPIKSFGPFDFIPEGVRGQVLEQIDARTDD
ncbi:GTPase family protein [Streptomyces sp. NPDC058268]|uniref:GTPase family protein n=1 Tax=Streptomyces sp. NPDC058268 TaxID=3346413 RepID=UPI0036F0A8FE